MTTQEKLREVLSELRAERESLDRKITAVETALSEAPVAKRRGRRPKAAATEQA